MAASLVIFSILLLTGCKDNFRIYSVAILDRMKDTDIGLLEIRDSLASHGVIIIDEDSISKLVDTNFIDVQKIRLCASMRSDRIGGAIALGRKLEVDAVIFSAMPSISKIKEETPCMVDSLISLYLIEPPQTLVEATNYTQFLYTLSLFDWETIVRPPPPPEEFVLSPEDSLIFAGYIITVEEAGLLKEESITKQTENQRNEILKKDKTDYSIKEKANGQATDKPYNGPKWSLKIIEDGYLKKTENFNIRVVGSISKALKYDVSVMDNEGKIEFKLILTDLNKI